MNQPGSHLLNGMGKGTVVAILALVQTVRKVRTEFCFVFFNMVKALNLAVSEAASIPILAQVSVLLAAQVCLVGSILAPAIF